MNPYLVGRLNIRALLDQHSHRFHVTALARENQRGPTALPSQPASVRRSGAAAAATHKRVHAWVQARLQMLLCVRLNKIVCVYSYATLDKISLVSA
jgi:hypothetical protein